jgi:hypothetical protein
MNPHLTVEDLESFVLFWIVTMNIWEIWTHNIFGVPLVLGVIFVWRCFISVMPSSRCRGWGHIPFSKKMPTTYALQYAVLRDGSSHLFIHGGRQILWQSHSMCDHQDLRVMEGSFLALLGTTMYPCLALLMFLILLILYGLLVNSPDQIRCVALDELF